jgi:ribose transport system ATP-binding protein
MRAGTRLAWAPQEALLPPDLTAEQFIFLGRELCRPLGWLRAQRMQAEAKAALHCVGCRVAPLTRLGTLPSPQRKQVQLARAVATAPNALLLDEPTAVLGDRESRDLFGVIRTLRQQEAGILYVSHRLDEVLAIADRVTVLRDGRRVSTDPVGNVDTPTLIQRMLGRILQPRQPRVRGGAATVLLALHEVAVAHVRGLSCQPRWVAAAG